MTRTWSTVAVVSLTAAACWLVLAPCSVTDATISRLQHAVIVYDSGTRAVRIFDGGKQNPIHVNGERLSGDRPVNHGDTIKIGLTTLRFTVA